MVLCPLLMNLVNKIFPDQDGDNRKPILWVSESKIIPPRPWNPGSFPEDDYRHWYDKEYAGWHVRKINIPRSPADGPNGKRVITLLPGKHPYNTAYERGMSDTADTFGIKVSFRYSDWDDEEQYLQVLEAIKERPDLIVLVPENSESSTAWYREINKVGIPVIASNLMPDDEGFRYILTWTGPDDWEQFRRLAAVFADKMNYKGGYTIITHIPGCSAYYARIWGIITELKRIAPEMQLLSAESTNLNTEKTFSTVTRWIMEFGKTLKGIVSPDDNLVQIGVNRALSAEKRTDIVRVANGSTRVGIRMLKEGGIDAITFQSAEMDGTLPLQVAVDWFNGLEVAPLKYLPSYILTRENVDEFVFNYSTPGDIDLDPLFQLIAEGNSSSVEAFFASLYQQFSMTGILTIEYFRGFSIKLLSGLLTIIRNNRISEKKIIGDYESIFKKLFNQQSMESTIEWLKSVSLTIISETKMNTAKPMTLIQQVVAYVDENYNKPTSLKVIADKFNISAAYLGKLFKAETGTGFSRYLNSLRIEQAKSLLISTPERANKIAIEVGYSDPNYFYSIFKKHTGMSPSEYIQRMTE